MTRVMSDRDAQQAWWDSMTTEQREAYKDRVECNRVEREIYGRTLTDDERALVIKQGNRFPTAIGPDGLPYSPLGMAGDGR